ncbi:MAG: CHAT domain-containing protein [Oscillospiraceae bacterium]|nr:CHAT domain-containing protein [Oscillospiraceae bacterium]
MGDSELYEQFKKLSADIEAEEEASNDSLISQIATLILAQKYGEELPDDDDYRIQEKQRNLRIFALLCIRINVCCKLMKSRYYSEMHEQLGEDIKSAEKYFGDIYRYRRSDPSAKLDILDILMIACPGSETVILDYFRKEYAISKAAKGELSDDVCFLVLNMADFFINSYDPDYGVLILENFCVISRKRDSLIRFQEIVATVLVRISEISPDTVARIVEDNEKYFRKGSNLYISDFCWFYAGVKHQQGDKEASLELYERCYEIRKSVLGEDNWFTTLAKIEIAIESYLSTHSEKDRKFLVSFVDRIESGYYDFADDYIVHAKIFEGRTLYFLLHDLNQIDDFEEYRRLLSLLEPIAFKYDHMKDSLVNIRLYKNLLGGYYIKTGDYIQAEVAFNDALAAKVDPEISEVLSDTLIKTNLLFIYYIQNDLEMANTVLPELLDAVDNEELSLTDSYRVLGLMMSLYSLSLVKLEDDYAHTLKGIAMDTCRDIIKSDPETEECICEAAAFVGSCAGEFATYRIITRAELQICKKALGIAYRKALPEMNVSQRVGLDSYLALLSQAFGDKNTDYYYRDAIKRMEDDNVSMSIRLAVLVSAGAYYCKCGFYNTGIRYTTQALQEIDGIWKSYIRYLNDERLLQILSPTQMNFTTCYSTLRRFQDVSSVYENVLRFKTLASLAGRERNRLLHQSDVSEALMKEIRTLQDRLSVLEDAGTFSDTEAETAEVKAKLRTLEADFAERFPHVNEVTDITWEKVKKAVPDNCVVLEFFYCTLSYGQTLSDLLDKEVEAGIDIYIIRKKNGECRLNRFTVKDGISLLDDTEEFTAILQEVSKDKATPEQLFRLEVLRKSLYDRLILPILPYVEEFRTVYIAPDSLLVNLPLEILYGDEQERLQDKHNIVRIECARDFLYSGDASDATMGELIIGNPKYDIRPREIEEEIHDAPEREDTRSSDAPHTRQLPFAAIEARRISEMSGSPYYTGIYARKDLLLSASGYRNIHVATHGMFDLGQNTNSMFSSYLLFAGADNRFEAGRADDLYGNGIVTADEISRLDLSSTELVVLSSCLSGMNDISLSRSFHGMISAFSAAGVHYVISHLWEAADFSTTILMDEFYRQYLKNKKSPPEALSIAKEYLRNVTVGELRENHWFDDIRKEEMEPRMMETLQKYKSMDDRRKPFRNEAYWGGFSCYQCY